MAEIVISANSRTDRGKNAARRLRMQGLIPAVIYGGKGDAEAVSVDPKTLRKVLRSESGRNTILKLSIGTGVETAAIIKSWQVDPVRENFLHADFFRIAMDVAIRVTVPVNLKGEARGVKVDGGILEVVMRAIEVECLPGEIPERLELDVTNLGINDALRVSDLPVSDKVKVLRDADQVIVHVIAVKEEVVATPAAVAVEGAPGSTPAEPEVAKKGKKDEEGGDKKA